MNARQRKQYWIREQRRQAKYIKSFRTKFFNALQNDTNRFVSVLQERGISAGKSFAESFLISPNVNRVMRQLYATAGARYAKDEFMELRSEKAFPSLTEWFNFILEYIGTEFYNRGLFKIVQTTRQIWLDKINEGLQEGLGVDEMVRNIRKEVPEINRYRAERITRTEAGKAISAGRYVGANNSPFEKEKIWISAKDKRTRGVNRGDDADHFHLDGQVVRFDEDFFDSRANEFLKHPHDPKGSAKSVINCRCSYVVRNRRDENGRLIRKRGLVQA